MVYTKYGENKRNQNQNHLKFVQIDSNTQTGKWMIKWTTEVSERVNVFKRRHQEVLNCVHLLQKWHVYLAKKSYPFRSIAQTWFFANISINFISSLCLGNQMAFLIIFLSNLARHLPKFWYMLQQRYVKLQNTCNLGQRSCCDPIIGHICYWSDYWLQM